MKRFGVTTLPLIFFFLSCASKPDLCLKEKSDPIKVCAGPKTIEGVDVSKWQGTVDWAKVKASGRVFAIARASDGLATPDSQFKANWIGMNSVGLIRGVYQYFRPSVDPIKQADLLLQKVNDAGGWLPTDLPPVLDIETTESLPNSTVVANAQKWLTYLEGKTGRRPIVYTAAFMSSALGSNFSKYDLWVANYGATCPSMPSGWSSWLMWQYSSTGSVSGISGNVDMNVYNGSVDALKAYIMSTWPKTDAGVVDSKTDSASDSLVVSDALQDGARDVLSDSITDSPPDSPLDTFADVLTDSLVASETNDGGDQAMGGAGNASADSADAATGSCL